ncbi:MAG: DNA polymerase III subunit alpha [Aerococcus sp.]|nr:DNA polymerase III subunit alpha [Aerococcus sp.]
MIPLYVHSAYSLLTSPMSIDSYVQSAKEKGYTHIGLADQNVLYGALIFYRAVKKAGLTPLIGMTVALQSDLVGQSKEEWLIYATSYVGYQSLMSLSTYLKTTDKINHEEVRQFILDAMHHRDWVVILPTPNSTVMNYLKQGSFIGAEKEAQTLRNAFSTGQLYLGVNPHPEMQSHVDQLKQLSETTDIPLLMTPYVEYADVTDSFTDQVMHSINTGETMDSPKVLYQQSQAEAYAALYPPATYQKWSEAAGLTDSFTSMDLLATMLTFEMPGKRRLLPRFPLPEGEDADHALKIQAEHGLMARLAVNEAMALPTDYTERLHHELTIIHEMGFDDYFLIVWDVMRYARQAKIRTGPGRGSAAGSLVSYALGITDVDPIQNQLLFERFLNPERQNMPDIDLDFPDNKRNQVVEYVYHKYGEDHVAQISTFGTFQARQALRDVGSVFGADQALLRQWSQSITHYNQSIREAYAASDRLKTLASEVPYGELWLETAQKIEGLPRHVSTHAAGVIISDAPLTEYVPLQSSQHFNIHQSQMAKDDVEGLGLLKMDFLSLINLTILDDSVHAAEKIAHHPLDPLQFDQEDAAVYELFSRAETLGIFQFESAGIRNVLRRLKPTAMKDVAAVNALYRPGPMKQIEHFIRRKHGQEPITYPDESVKPILEETYGIMVYQEQVMQVAQVVAGFSLGEADILRRSMSKKDQAEMSHMHTRFRKGALSRGYTGETIELIFNYIAEFADYGFNKSHAYAYSYLAYQLAWLKVHYPSAFYYGNVKSVQSFEKKGVQLLKEAEMHHIQIEAPDVNTSFNHLVVKDRTTLQLGIGNIRGIPNKLSYEIVTNRLQDGPYANIIDFVHRLSPQYANTDLLMPLAKAGALDSFGYTRHALVEGGLANVCRHVDFLPDLNTEQMTLEGMDAPKKNGYVPNINRKLAEYPKSTLAAGEIETLGLAVKTKLYQDFYPYYQTGQLTYIENITPTRQRYRVIGEIVSLKRITTKKNDPMAFLTLRDESGEIEVTLFPSDYIRFAGVVHEGETVYLVGRAQERQQRVQLVASQVKRLEDLSLKLSESKQRVHVLRSLNIEALKQSHPHGYCIQVASRKRASEKKQALLQLIQAEAGDYPVYFWMEEEQIGEWLAPRFHLSGANETLTHLESLYGNENVSKW